jgi:adenylate cyclase
MERKYAIMFSDVAGSTSLYDTLGNDTAEHLIGTCVQNLIRITKNNYGQLIKTIGDEVMCRFDNPNDATRAAIEMQIATEADKESNLSIRIGMHYGPAIEKDNDIFGDAVNLAARMAGIAKARQIITTDEMINELSSDLAELSRLFDRAKVKGKEEEIKIFQIVWEKESKVTKFATSHEMKKVSNCTVAIVLKYADQEKLYTDGDMTKALSIGKDENCDISIDADYASREHANLEFRRGKFVLIDHSTNGTYVLFKGQDDIFLRREELPLMGEGLISLGEDVIKGNPNLISFSILQPKK